MISILAYATRANLQQLHDQDSRKGIDEASMSVRSEFVACPLSKGIGPEPHKCAIYSSYDFILMLTKLLLRVHRAIVLFAKNFLGWEVSSSVQTGCIAVRGRQAGNGRYLDWFSFGRDVREHCL